MLPPILSKPSKVAHLAIAFVTLGALIMVWNTVWYAWMVHVSPASDPNQPHNDGPFYWCAAFFFSGLTLFVIGFALGRIGRAARKAEMPPEVAPGEQTAQPAVAPQPVVQTPVVNGQAVLPSQVGVPMQPVAAVQPTPPTAPVAPTAQVR